MSKIDEIAARLSLQSTRDDLIVRQLMARVDESSLTLDDWIAAWREVADWLNASSKIAEPSDVLGYITCAAEICERSNPPDSLIFTTRDLLKKKGFERARFKSGQS